MEKYLKKGSMLLVIILLVMAFGALVQYQEAYAKSKTIERVAYNEVMKYKNTVYCASPAGIYKVKLRNGKMKKKTCLTKEAYEPYAMRKKGKCIYYIDGSNGTQCTFARVGIKTHKVKYLADGASDFAYAIKGKKIYYSADDYDGVTYKHRVMKLNGKNKKFYKSVFRN